MVIQYYGIILSIVGIVLMNHWISEKVGTAIAYYVLVGHMIDLVFIQTAYTGIQMIMVKFLGKANKKCIWMLLQNYNYLNELEGYQPTENVKL